MSDPNTLPHKAYPSFTTPDRMVRVVLLSSGGCHIYIGTMSGAPDLELLGREALRAVGSALVDAAKALEHEEIPL